MLKPSLGREGWCQRLLTELILDGPYPAYNSRRRPSARGVTFLGALDELSFGVKAASMSDLVFVDEIDFPARHPDEKGCAPDYTVFLDGRCWIIELKTEPGSHRPRQIPDYFERAHHYHPQLQVDITYLTAGLRAPFQPATRAWERYVHIEWTDTVELIRSAWSSSPDQRVLDIVTTLLKGITHLDEPAHDWWERLGFQVPASGAPEPANHPAPSPARLDASTPSEVELSTFQDGLSLARATGDDGKQRAIGLETGGLEALDALRLALRQTCRSEPPGSPLRRVQPWLWNAATSGGKAMTTAGLQTGYEVRISRTRPAT
jgi:hypothetical protein